ncbi:MAG: IclR family transcriptional regulator [Alphaproteobacteria bacterium]|nr:IclR family transcriptional regulator [Alphaproteobacteria bacterium]
MSVVNPFVDRVLDVVSFVAERARGCSLGEISGQLKLSKSATHRMLAALVARGWVEQESETGFYRLTLRLPAMAHRYLGSTRLIDIVQPVVDRLARASLEHVRLAAVAGRGLTWLTTAQGATSGLIFRGGSGRLPLHATANGRAWLASLDDEAACRIVLEAGFGATGEFGPNAPRSIDVFLDRLAETRRLGFAVNVEESEVGVAAVAAAIRCSPEAPVVGTISVSGPAIRFTRKRAFEVAREMMLPAAAELGDLWPLRAATLQNSLASAV